MMHGPINIRFTSVNSFLLTTVLKNEIGIFEAQAILILVNKFKIDSNTLVIHTYHEIVQMKTKT